MWVPMKGVAGSGCRHHTPSSILDGMISLQLPSPLVEVHDARVESRGVRLYLKRDDLIHVELSGNKWRKLKYNIRAAREQGVSTLLTFGGAYSNHIRATAAAGYHFDFKKIWDIATRTAVT